MEINAERVNACLRLIKLEKRLRIRLLYWRCRETGQFTQAWMPEPAVAFFYHAQTRAKEHL